MNDKNIHRLQFGLIVASVIFLLTASRLLFGSWISIHPFIWIIIGIFAWGVLRTFRTIWRKNLQVIFIEFDYIQTVTVVGIISLATAMFLIFYPLLSIFFYGLFLATLGIAIGLKFITFDFDKKNVIGLISDSTTDLKSVTIEIQLDNNQIEIKAVDKDDCLVLKKEGYNNKVWKQLIDTFQEIKART